jgi:hypothetical protein
MPSPSHPFRLEPLVFFLRQAGEGGGADKVRQRVVAEYRERYPGLHDMELRKRTREEVETRMREVALRESLASGITTEVEELQRQNQDSFAIPGGSFIRREPSLRSKASVYK